ncbi:RNase HII [Syntrophus gentianae]|uniref:Ribonuclease HII n=1 Tax=Syntrophus gentianae TaxID=43775 RepID=A0A1H7YPL5_9BACT|nr:ribonuclease HII [Syntrophus gentianae]SEM48040.1 RNase HII [Syntrophus gentianae]
MNSFEEEAYQKGYRVIAGIDEAGRGPLAGPVVAAAVILPRGYCNPEITDSKKLSAKKRERLYEVIKKEALAVGVGVMEPHRIDQVNILQATLLAMAEAVEDLSSPPDYLLVDGLHRVPLDIPQKTVVKGDALSVSIASASIIAKVSRDQIMEIYHRQFPQYNFLKNKGYGTREHREAILSHGLCKIHRRSFKTTPPKPPCLQTADLFD